MLDWLDRRTGYRALLEGFLDEPVKGGPRWAYVFGSLLTFLFLVQVVTGVLMASYYAPSVTSAWASVAYIQDQVTLGWFIRGLHAYGASAMIVVLGLHLGQVVAYGAYRAPREVNYWAGLLMLMLVMGLSLTGYLLPWDQKGYWATQVATSIMGTLPVAGDHVKTLVQGGASYGNLTLTRFFALHAWVLPGGLVLLTTFHIYLFRRHGVTPAPGRAAEEIERTTAPFGRGQLERDLVAMAICTLIGVISIWRSHGAELGAPADPTSSFLARPEWYFLPLFQLLKYFEGPLEVIGTIVVPGLFFTLLFAMPLWDRGPSRALRDRKPVVAFLLLSLCGIVGLGVAAELEDRRSPELAKQVIAAEESANRARALAKAHGVPPEGGVAVFQTDPQFRALEIWKERCSSCHSLDGRSNTEAPDLKDYNSRSWLVAFLKNPDDPLKFGKVKLELRMKPVKGTDEELGALADFERSLTGAKDVDAASVARGKELFAAKNCDECHETDGEKASEGPNLGGRGSLEWLRAVISDAGQPRLYGKQNKMPAFGKKLSPEDIDLMATFVLAQRR